MDIPQHEKEAREDIARNPVVEYTANLWRWGKFYNSLYHKKQIYGDQKAAIIADLVYATMVPRYTEEFLASYIGDVGWRREWLFERTPEESHLLNRSKRDQTKPRPLADWATRFTLKVPGTLLDDFDRLARETGFVWNEWGFVSGMQYGLHLGAERCPPLPEPEEDEEYD